MLLKKTIDSAPLHKNLAHFLMLSTKSKDKNSLGFKNTNPRTLSTSFPLGNHFSLALLYRGHQLEIAQDAQDISLNYS